MVVQEKKKTTFQIYNYSEGLKSQQQIRGVFMHVYLKVVWTS